MSTTLRLLAVLLCALCSVFLHATSNQTDDLNPVLPEASLPYRVVIEQSNLRLPAGVHSGVIGTYKEFWIYLAGRLDGLHGFGPNPFSAQSQNRSIFVVNSLTGATFSRSLSDPSSGLTQEQIDLLSVTSPESYQENHTLYMAGGYGINTNAGTFSTKPVLTAIYLPGIVQWVTQLGVGNQSVNKNIRQLTNPVFQVTGGKMYKLGNLTQIAFGQNFTGVYNPGSNGNYNEQIRQFQLRDVNGQLSVAVYPSKPSTPDPNFRRRDLNILPALINIQNHLQYSLVAFSGVFTPANGVWTVPVVIYEKGDPVMANPSAPTTFKQAMNQYISATAGLYSRKYSSMYNLFFGGMSYGFYAGGTFQTDAEIPFINQVTTISMDSNGLFTQYLMDSQYPVILSTQANPGNPLLFGAGADFIVSNISRYANGVINLDAIRSPTVIGYIVGGIQSTLPNTALESDSSASAYVFKVTLIPR